MTALRTLTLPLLLAATLGVSACGGDDTTSGGGSDAGAVATPDPVTETVEEKSKELETKVKGKQAELESITKDIQSGKLNPKEGQKKIEKITNEIQAESTDLAAEAAAAAKAAGEQATELDLGGDAPKAKN